MRFCGHETFPIREGWLYKGLDMLMADASLLGDEYVADHLGVGRNMAKAIRHWLLATGLAERGPGSARSRKTPLEPTLLGTLVADKDPHFLEIGTWWALHVNLVNTPEHAASWSWFFNSFNLERFERSIAVENLRRHVQLSRSAMPSIGTLERDVACLLSSYARSIPEDSTDPEEQRDCPFRELGLLSYFKTSGYYQLHQGAKPVPPELFGYAAAMAFSDAGDGEGATDITIHDAARQPGGPGRAFALTSEALFEVALRAETKIGNGDIQIAGLAGSRVVRVRKKPPLDWLVEYYSRAEQEVQDAA